MWVFHVWKVPGTNVLELCSFLNIGFMKSKACNNMEIIILINQKSTITMADGRTKQLSLPL